MYADVHCHLLEEHFPDKDLALNSAQKAGVKRVIVNGINHEDNVKISQWQHPILRRAFGLHPCYKHKNIDETISWIKKNESSCIAIGEIGLDKHWEPETFEGQVATFTKMLKLAQELGKPVIVHSRKAEREVLDFLRVYKVKAVLHAFGGRKTFIREGAEYKHYFSIPANVVRNEQTQMLAQIVPLGQLLTETDAPFMSAEKDKQSQPKDVVNSIAKLAEIKQITPEECANQIYMNYQRCFND